MTDAPPLQSEPAIVAAPTTGSRLRSAAGYAVAVALMLVWPPLFIFVPATLLRCGLRNGRGAAWLALAVGAIAAAMMVVPIARSPQMGHEANLAIAYLLGLLLAVALPSLLVLPMIERAESFGRVLSIAILASVVGLLATEATMRGAVGYSPYADEIATAGDTGTKLVAAYEKGGMPADVVRFVRRTMDFAVYCVPGLLVVEVITVFVVSFLIFGRFRRWRERLAGKSPALNPYLFRNLSLPDWLLFAFILAGISPLATGALRHAGANALAVVVFLYFLQGLAVFRAIVLAAGAGFGATFFAWGMLGFLMLTGFAPLMLSIAGLFDSFFDFRHFNRKDHSDESHSH
jgi:hypothetical protein